MLFGFILVVVLQLSGGRIWTTAPLLRCWPAWPWHLLLDELFQLIRADRTIGAWRLAQPLEHDGLISDAWLLDPSLLLLRAVVTKLLFSDRLDARSLLDLLCGYLSSAHWQRDPSGFKGVDISSCRSGEDSWSIQALVTRLPAGTALKIELKLLGLDFGSVWLGCLRLWLGRLGGRLGSLRPFGRQRKRWVLQLELLLVGLLQ